VPELPEVETVANNLASKITSKLCTKILIHDPKLQNAPQNRAPLKIISVSRFGKEILINFLNQKSKKNLYLLIHLRMSGRLLHNTENNISATLKKSESYLEHKIIRIKSDNYSKHIRATFKLENSEMYFFDVRRFGTFKWLKEPPQLPENVIDPVQNKLTLSALEFLLQKSKNAAVKQFLLRQDRIVGIGNIYASEIVYKSNIHPERKCSSLTTNEMKILLRQIPAILKKAIKYNGTTFSDFQLEDSSTGKFQNFLKVYGKENQQCMKCMSTILKITQGQRSTFFCPTCQM
jgi:formamidopyrimidine-DNA glycosylase